jgi:hypothetical protein
LPLLYDIRYFYQSKINGSITTGIIPPFELTDEEVLFFHSKFVEIFDNSKSKYKPKSYLKKYNFEPKELWELRSDIFFEGYQIDPMAKWYTFIRTVRLSDYNKFEKITKVVRLAHDYYVLAELLTFFYIDAVDDKIFDPIDMFDGGKWRIGKCTECGREIKTQSSREKYCKSCKRKIVAGEGTKYKCYKCGKSFYKYVDGDEMVNKPFKNSKKSKDAVTETVTNVKLDYGRMTVYTQCECGALNYTTLEKGWS